MLTLFHSHDHILVRFVVTVNNSWLLDTVGTGMHMLRHLSSLHETHHKEVDFNTVICNLSMSCLKLPHS